MLCLEYRGFIKKISSEKKNPVKTLLDKPDIRHKAKFDFIRYANCWEDADILLQGLNAPAGGRFLSVCSAGDNSFSLLTANPETVVATDINKVQLYLTELKKASFICLTYEEFLSFLGFAASDTREKLFNRLQAELSEPAKIYWEQNFGLIKKGIIYQGKFEKYFKLFRKIILPCIHSRKTVQQLLEPKSREAQERFYYEKWNTIRYRLFFKIFFSKFVSGKFGRDPQFLKEVKIPVSKFIFNNVEGLLTTEAAQHNYFLKFILTGTFGSVLPHYARRENFENIKANISKLHITEGFAEQALTKYPPFNYFNLSNIFEYMDDKTYRKAAEAIVKGSAAKSNFAYWNLMVPRRCSYIMPEKFSHKKQLSEMLSRQDKGFFYSSFIIEEKICPDE